MLRENFYDVLKSLDTKVDVVVVPKNSGLKGYAWKVLKEAGLDLDNAEKVDDTTLRVGTLTILLRRGEDIPQVITDEFRLGRIVLGITGDDLLDEYRLRNPANTLKVENTYDWFDREAKYFRPALCLISTPENSASFPSEARIALNTKYEFTSRLEIGMNPQLSGRKFFVTVYNGDIEDRVGSGANDYCIDTVYRGTSINRQGLVEVGDPIRFSDLVVISPLKKDGLGLLERMASMIPMGPVIERSG